MEDLKIICCMNSTDDLEVNFDGDKVFLVLNSTTNDIGLDVDTAAQLRDALSRWIGEQ